MRTTFLVILFCLLFLAPFATAMGEQAIYVHPLYGNDADSGAMEAPIQSLTEAVRRLSMAQGDTAMTVWLHGGEYVMRETLFVRDLNLPQVAFRAVPGEIPVITGAPQVHGWAETVFLGRTVWAAQLELSQLRALYGLDGPRQNSRWPKEGMLEVERPIAKTDNKFEQQDSFYANTKDLPNSLSGAFVRLLHWWKDEMSGVRAYDSSSGLLQLNRKLSMSVEKGNLYWLENVLNVPLNPGEWVYDPVNRTLYYAPRDGETMDNTPLYAGAVEQVINMNRVNNLLLEGITFARTGWNIPNYDTYSDFQQAAFDVGSAIYLGESLGIRFSGCKFRDIGSGAIRIDALAKDVKIADCTFEDIGAQAVFVSGKNMADNWLVTERIQIENNHINGYAKTFYNAAAILIIHARHVEIAHNEIHDGTYTAISAGWVWGDGFNVTDFVQIRNNHIYDIGQGMLSDMGAVYMLGGQANSIISGNVIHDVNCKDYGGWGIYLDEGSSGITVTSNLVYRCSSQGFHQHNGIYNTVENNIFALNKDGQVGASGKGTFFLDKNVIVGGKPHLTKNDGGTIREGNNLYTEDTSLFVDAANENFALKDSGLLDGIGFVPWVFIAGVYFVI